MLSDTFNRLDCFLIITKGMQNGFGTKNEFCKQCLKVEQIKQSIFDCYEFGFTDGCAN
jgi:hypothetical protein